MPTLTRTKPPAKDTRPSQWTHTVKPSAGPGGGRIEPDAAEIRFHAPKTSRGLGAIEIVIGPKIAAKVGLSRRAIFRISTDLTKARIEPAPSGTVGALKVTGTHVLRIRAAARGWPTQVVEAIAYATLPPINTADRKAIALDVKAVDGGLEFTLPPSRAHASRSRP